MAQNSFNIDKCIVLAGICLHRSLLLWQCIIRWVRVVVGPTWRNVALTTDRYSELERRTWSAVPQTEGYSHTDFFVTP